MREKDRNGKERRRFKETFYQHAVLKMVIANTAFESCLIYYAYQRHELCHVRWHATGKGWNSHGRCRNSGRSLCGYTWQARQQFFKQRIHKVRTGKLTLEFEDSVSITWPHLLIVDDCIMTVVIVCRLSLFTSCVARFPSKPRNREAPEKGVFVLLLLLLLLIAFM